MKLHQVEVRIPAVIVLRGKVEADTEAGAKKAAEAEAQKIVKEFSATDRPILEGMWPEVLGRASVQALVAKGAKPTASTDV